MSGRRGESHCYAVLKAKRRRGEPQAGQASEARGQHSINRKDWTVAGALFLAIFLVTLFTAEAYGPTYDEPFYVSAGGFYAKWWGRVFTGDTSALHANQITEAWHLNHEHPPLQKVASGVSQAVFGGLMPGLTAMRLPSALWFALAVAGLYLFLVGVWGRAGAVFSALALATLPRVFAHAHFIALDIAIMTWFFLTAALMAVALERDSWKWTVAAGIAFGLALDAKVNAFFLPFLLVPWGLIWYRARWSKLVAALLIGPAFFFLSWPWMWVTPAAHLHDYLAFHFRHAAYNVWYLGKLYQYAPWHYPFVMTAVTTPALVLLFALGGIPLTWPRRGVDPRRALLLLGLAVALIPNALPNTPKYNGVRLFLPAFPFLMALAGGSFAWLADHIRKALAASRNTRLAALATVAIGVVALAPPVAKSAALHPYQLAYYNELVGGTKGATARGFETIYWGQVFQDGVGFLNTRPKNATVVVIPGGVIYLLEFQQRGALRRALRFTGDEGEAARADLVLFQGMQSDYTELCWALVRNERPVYTITADGAPVLLAFDHAAVVRALERLPRTAAAPQPSSAQSASSETNNPTR